MMTTFTDGEGRLWPFWAFVLSALLSCAAFVVAGYLAAELAGDHVLRFELVFRPVLVVLLLGAFSWLLTVGDHVEEHLIAAQGLPLSAGWARHFLVGCGLGVVMVIIGIIAVALGARLSFRTTCNLHSLMRVSLVLIVLLAGALAEELMFRGYPFQRLVEAIGAAGSFMVFSVLFGVVHLSNPGASVWGLFNTVAIGLLLAVAYLRTRALWLPWGIHFAWNATLGLVLGLPVSGIRFFNVAIHGTATGPRWLTGGAYGIEASVPGAVAVLVGLIIIWRVPLKPLKSPAAFLPSEPPSQTNPPDVTTQTHPPPELGL